MQDFLRLRETIFAAPEAEAIALFQEEIWTYYAKQGRHFSWRENITPYGVVVSEIMLQQTQTHRVAQKYDCFIEKFEDFSALAEAPFSEVLALWKGLGYNRRALNLQKIATIVMEQHQGLLPEEEALLETFPGIGKATARSIVSFAFNKPVAFIETNIRTVFLFFFFAQDQRVHDREILLLVQKTLPRERARDWYYALMDYGVMLKKEVGSLNAQSVHYKVQSRFAGSDRQLRGRILEFLLKGDGDIHTYFADEEARLSRILKQLCTEGLVKEQNGSYVL